MSRQRRFANADTIYKLLAQNCKLSVFVWSAVKVFAVPDKCITLSGAQSAGFLFSFLDFNESSSALKIEDFNKHKNYYSVGESVKVIVILKWIVLDSFFKMIVPSVKSQKLMKS